MKSCKGSDFSLRWSHSHREEIAFESGLRQREVAKQGRGEKDMPGRAKSIAQAVKPTTDGHRNSLKYLSSGHFLTCQRLLVKTTTQPVNNGKTQV